MVNEIRLLMLSAMYENGGNTTHRFLDGHSGMFVYPFESQVGTRLVSDSLSSLCPAKYRWPEFALTGHPQDDYSAIIDEEVKVRARTPHVSKFRHVNFDLSDAERFDIYKTIVDKTGRSRANNVAAFFQATFDAWGNLNRSGKESVYVGYNPVQILDANKIVEDLPNAHIVHIVRNPWSAFADTKKRPVPMSLPRYIELWNLNQHYALLYQKLYPSRITIIRTEDILANPVEALSPICQVMGLESEPILGKVTWNGLELDEVYPWGTIRSATSIANLNTANELSVSEKEEIRTRCWQYLDVFKFGDFLA